MASTFLEREIKLRPVYEHANLSSVGVQFNARYADIPGMLYMLLQRVDERDTQRVFDTLFESFLIKSGAGQRWVRD